MLNQWSRIERVLLVVTIIISTATLIAAFMAWDMNNEIDEFNRLYISYGELAESLSVEHDLNLYVSCNYWIHGIPQVYIIVVAEDQRYHVNGAFDCSRLFIDYYPVADGWVEIDNELILLRSRLDLGL